MKKLLMLSLLTGTILLSGCSKTNNEMEELSAQYSNNIVYYELFVRSSFDSDGDGIGDFKGIEDNVSYFTDLGIEGIWFMPVNASNSYHGYDVYDYMDVHEDYGTMEEFKSMVKVLTNNNIKVMMDFVVNHSSNEHQWFIDSQDPNSKYRDYYVYINGNPYNYFGSGMPDLNLGNDDVFNEIIEIGKYYIDMGVGGFRLDAAKHFFQIEENQLNATAAIAKSNDFIRRMRTEFQKYDEDFFIVSEVLDSNLMSSQFFKGGDSAFNFDLREKILDVASGSGADSYSNVVLNNYKQISQYNYDFIDSPFATNHDLDRISYELNQNSEFYDKQLKLIADMLLTLPGSPFIYYGDELGQNGYRQEGTNLPGYGTVWDEYRRLPLKTGLESQTSWITTNIDDNVDSYLVQKEDENSLYNHYKNMINIRNTNKALKFGNDFQKTNLDFNFATSFIRTFEGQNLLIIHNPYQNKLDISNLNLSNAIYKTNDTTNLSVDTFSTIIFELTEDELARLV
ncbi:MAG: alpha-amylase family glycosyl hydrolase [bacterium]